jgi:hypothetical protein
LECHTKIYLKKPDIEKDDCSRLNLLTIKDIFSRSGVEINFSDVNVVTEVEHFLPREQIFAPWGVFIFLTFVTKIYDKYKKCKLNTNKTQQVIYIQNYIYECGTVLSSVIHYNILTYINVAVDY